jgi:hypothetical protein
LSIEGVSEKYKSANAEGAEITTSRCSQKLVEQIKIIHKEELKKNDIK